MPKLIFLHASGTQHLVDGRVGQSVMEAAVENLIPVIKGECGGCASCATCHVLVDPAWQSRLPPRSLVECDLLEGAGFSDPDSRLGCQLALTESMDGIVLRLPAEF